MNAKEMFKRLKKDKKLTTLILMLICGASLIALSFFVVPQQENTTYGSADLTYTTGDSIEARLSRVLSQIAGAGTVDVLVLEDGQEIRGVLIVADGAGELTVRTELMRAAMTALDVPASSVEVFAKKMDQGE